MILTVRMVEQESKYFVHMEDNTSEYALDMRVVQQIEKPIGDPYEGDYNVKPNFSLQTLETKRKFLSEDITVEPIEVSRVSNPSGGKTIYIGGIFNG